MDKRLIIGGIAGLILGLVEKLLFEGGIEMLIIPAILGVVIAFISLQNLKINFYLLSALVGALFFVIIAIRTGLWLDDLATGAITGLVIGFLIQFLGKQMK